MSLRKAYQEAERLWAALKQCALEEERGHTGVGWFLKCALESVEGVRSVLRLLAAPPESRPLPANKPGRAWVDGDGVVRFRIEDVPPLYQSVDASTRGELKRLWAGAIVRLAREAGIAPRFRRARVAVTVAAWGKWDLDNRSLKPLLEGLKRALVIRDDDCGTVSLELKGIPLAAGEREYTEIAVYGEDPEPFGEETEEFFSFTPCQ
jgi:hypothetical protein